MACNAGVVRRATDGSFVSVPSPVDEIITSGGTVDYADSDSIFNQYDAATVDHEWIMQTQITSGDGELLTFRSGNESVATVDSSGRVKRVVDGVAPIFTDGNYITRRSDVAVSRELGAVTYELYNFALTSLSKNVHTKLGPLANILGKSTDIYSTRDLINKEFIRNTNFWGASLDITAVAAYGHDSIGGGSFRAATMVTAKHFIQADHWYSPQGTKLYFVDAANTVYERTVAVPPYRIAGDLSIGTLDVELPAGIKPCKLPTSNWDTWKIGHPSIYPSASGNGITQYPSTKCPAICTNQYGKASFVQLYAASPTGSGLLLCSESRPSIYPYTNYEIEVISGDSGSPSIRHINNEPVLFTTWWGAYGGMDFSKYVSQINAYITPYAVSVADFGMFPNFP